MADLDYLRMFRYPGSLERLFEYTPDECIPEFFLDSTVFSSIHADMEDLKLPCWARSVDHFLSVHRAVLECSGVSQRIHQWIDLTFGVLLSGSGAVEAKNVFLRRDEPRALLWAYSSNAKRELQLPADPNSARFSSTDSSLISWNTHVVPSLLRASDGPPMQLFREPHPPRRTTGKQVLLIFPFSKMLLNFLDFYLVFFVPSSIDTLFFSLSFFFLSCSPLYIFSYFAICFPVLKCPIVY